MKTRQSFYLKCLAITGVFCVVAALACHHAFPPTAQKIPNPIEQLANQDAQTEFNVVVFSDIAHNFKTMDQELEPVNATQADFAICNGDLGYSGSSENEYSYVQRKLIQKIKMPLFILPGNHDNHPKVGFKRYRDFFGPERYFWSYADTLFVAINTGNLHFDDTEYRFLKQTLEQERAKFRRCVLVMHCPPVDLRPHKNTHGIQNQQENDALAGLVADHHVDMIVTSHLHWFLEGRFAGVPIFHPPSGGQRVRDTENPNIGYVLMSFKKNGDIQLKRENVTAQRGRNMEFICLWTAQYSSLIICIGLALFSVSVCTALLSARQTAKRPAYVFKNEFLVTDALELTKYQRQTGQCKLPGNECSEKVC